MSIENDLHALVRAERAGDEAAADAALDRVLSLAASAAGPDPLVRAQVARSLGEALGAAGGAGAGWRGSSWARAGSKLGLVTVGVAIGFVWGRAPEWTAERDPAPTHAASHAELASTAPPAAVVDSAREPGAGALPVMAPETVDAAVPSLAIHPTASPRARAVPDRRHPTPARVHPRAKPAPSGNDTLRIALEQLRKAQLFLSASEPARALTALDELDARVPAAVLSEERDVTRALALCKTGDTARAVALAARVLERAPDSAYALSLRESCAGQELLVEQMRERTSNRAQ